MKSPFAGMDPYVEACELWEDFHPNLIVAIQHALSAVVPERYIVAVGQRFYITTVTEDGKEDRTFIPDVGLTNPSGTGRTAVAETPVAVGASIEMEAYLSQEVKEAFIEVRDEYEGNSLVTSIEILSPSNKKANSKGREQFITKRENLFCDFTNVVELDLLRGGPRMPMRTPWPNSPYTAFIARMGAAPRGRAWPITFHDPMPVLPIPLLRIDPPVDLPLQAVVDTVYASARYGKRIDYRRVLSKPPLPADDERRLREVLAARG